MQKNSHEFHELARIFPFSFAKIRVIRGKKRQLLLRGRLPEKEMVAKSGEIETLTSPMNSEGKEFLEARNKARESLEQEFRERFCSDLPNGRIEWGKLGEFLRNKKLISSEP